MNFPCKKKGYLRLGVPYGLGKIIFDGLIADFSLEYPDIMIDLCGHGSCQVMELLSNGKIDIGACIQPPDISDKFDGIPLMHDRYFLVVNRSHPLAGRKSVRYEELKDEQFYMLNNEYTMTQITKQNFLNAGFEPIVKMIVERSDIMGTMIAKSQGIAETIFQIFFRSLSDGTRRYSGSDAGTCRSVPELSGA